MNEVLSPRAPLAAARINTMLAVVLGVLLLAVAFGGGYRIGFEDGRSDGLAAGRAAAPAAKSDFQLCMDRMDRDLPSAPTVLKIERCKPQ
jgi:uncharacterized protein (DUF849 family)